MAEFNAMTYPEGYEKFKKEVMSHFMPDEAMAEAFMDTLFKQMIGN